MQPSALNTAFYAILGLVQHVLWDLAGNFTKLHLCQNGALKAVSMCENVVVSWAELVPWHSTAHLSLSWRCSAD